MKIFTKTLLTALVLGTASTAIYATGDVAEKSSAPKGCGELCTGSIPIELTVLKHCDLDVLTSKITLSDGGSGTGSFKVGANAPYNLLVSTTNNSRVKNGNNEIPIIVTTNLAGSTTNIPLGAAQTNQSVAIGGWNTYNVKVTSQEVGISKPAGIYTDEYNIRVYF